MQNLYFFSRVEDCKLDALRESAMICIVPSNQEGFGIPLIESMASGSYTIHSDIQVFSEILLKFNTLTTRSFAAGSSEDLALSMLSVMGEIDQHGLSEAFGKSSVENAHCVEKNFSWGVSAEKVRGLIDEAKYF